MITKRKLRRWYRDAEDAYQAAVNQHWFGLVPVDLRKRLGCELAYLAGKQACKDHQQDDTRVSWHMDEGTWIKVLAAELRPS